MILLSPHEIISTAGNTSMTQHGSGSKAENYSSISATNCYDIRIHVGTIALQDVIALKMSSPCNDSCFGCNHLAEKENCYCLLWKYFD